jgi:membrane-associated protease RseP (regulator of RpoE activity)
MKRLLPILLIAASALADLPRRAAAGLAVEADEGTVIVREAFPNSAAAAAGLQRGDVILSLDGEAVATTLDVTSRFGRRKAGDAVKVEYVRANEKRVATVIMKEWPREQADSYDVTYGEVTADGNRYRTLATKPKGAAPTATLFIVQGVGCSPVDNPPAGTATVRWSTRSPDAASPRCASTSREPATARAGRAATPVSRRR